VEAFLKFQKDGPVVTLTMNNPAMRNTLTAGDGGGDPVDELVEACARISADHSVRAVVLVGADPAFSAGGNLKAMRHQFKDKIEAARIRQQYRLGIQRVPLALYNLEVPTIAAVNGAAIGAGCDLACMCDIRIASDKASFAESFVKVGLVSGDGGSWLLPRIVGMSRAAELSFTGDELDAQQALACGLVSRVVPHEQLLSEAQALARRIAANPGQALRMTKRLLREGQTLRLESQLEMAAAFQALAHQTAQHEEAVQAFIEKRPPRFTDD
jgi:enoyl-CoA hydratase/carnithine racemase